MRQAGAFMLLAVLGGCMTSDKTAPGQPHQFGAVSRAREVPNAQGPFGQPVPVYNAVKDKAPGGDIILASAQAPSGGVQQAGFGAKADCADCDVKGIKGGHKLGHGGLGHGGHGLHGGAGGGVISHPKWDRMGAGLPAPPPGAVAAVGALPGIPTGAGGPGLGSGRTSVRFVGPAGMKIAWFSPSPESKNGFTATQVEVPGRYNFVQGGIYRLKVTDVPNRPGLELYPTLEVRPANARTCTFIAHSSVPVGFTEEDFEQVAAGNLVVKVVYLPNPEFQELAVAGPDEVVSTRLEPGVDPILEATRRGSVLLVIRLGNIDLEAPNTPALNAPPSVPGMGMPGMPGPGMGMPGMPGPGMGMPIMAPPGGTLPGALPVAPNGTMTLPPATPLPNGTLPPGAIPGAVPGPNGTYVLPPGAPLPPGAVPQGTPLPPGAVPLPHGTPLPPPAAVPPGTAPAGPPPGRASVTSPFNPTVRLPDAPPPLPAGRASVSVDGMVGQIK
jgi:hypothetical protein